MKLQVHARYIATIGWFVPLLVASSALAAPTNYSLAGSAYEVTFSTTTNNVYLLRNNVAIVETPAKNFIPLRWSQTADKLCLHNGLKISECWSPPIADSHGVITLMSSCNAVSGWRRIDASRAARNIASLETRDWRVPQIKLASVGTDR
jgi:hypothetical protein